MTSVFIQSQPANPFPEGGASSLGISSLSLWRQEWNLVRDFWTHPISGLRQFVEEALDVETVTDSYATFAKEHGFMGELVQATACSGLALTHIGLSIPLFFRGLAEETRDAWKSADDVLEGTDAVVTTTVSYLAEGLVGTVESILEKGGEWVYGSLREKNSGEIAFEVSLTLGALVLLAQGGRGIARGGTRMMGSVGEAVVLAPTRSPALAVATAGIAIDGGIVLAGLGETAKGGLVMMSAGSLEHGESHRPALHNETSPQRLVAPKTPLTRDTIPPLGHRYKIVVYERENNGRIVRGARIDWSLEHFDLLEEGESVIAAGQITFSEVGGVIKARLTGESGRWPTVEEGVLFVSRSDRILMAPKNGLIPAKSFLEELLGVEVTIRPPNDNFIKCCFSGRLESAF